MNKTHIGYTSRHNQSLYNYDKNLGDPLFLGSLELPLVLSGVVGYRDSYSKIP